MQIRHLRHNEINYSLWDKCITNAKNSLVYASTWYLDVVSPDWEALVAGNYEYIMCPYGLKNGPSVFQRAVPWS